MAEAATNATIRRFGYPATVVREYAHWIVLLRPSQPTLGSLVVAARGEETAFSALASDAFVELATVTAEVEAALRAAVAFDRINWLMLMMADPHVHFHVLPRYEGSRCQAGIEVIDRGWPRLPDLAGVVELDEAGIAALVAWLRDYFPS